MTRKGFFTFTTPTGIYTSYAENEGEALKMTLFSRLKRELEINPFISGDEFESLKNRILTDINQGQSSVIYR